MSQLQNYLHPPAPPNASYYNHYVFPWFVREFGITDWKLVLPPSEEEDEIAVMRKREIEVNIAASIKNLGFIVEMNEDGEFTFKKEPPAPPADQPPVAPANQPPAPVEEQQILKSIG